MDSTVRLLRFLAGLALGAFALASPPVSAGDAEASVPAVRALLFYAQQCPECDTVLDYLLPVLHERYGVRIEVAALDAGEAGGRVVYQAASRQGLPPEWPGLPVAMVGERAVVGLDAIARTLGDEFELLAASGATARWPDLPGLPALLGQGVRNVQARLAAERGAGAPAAPGPGTSDADRVANAIAVVVLAGMVVALLHSLVRVRRPAGVAGTGPWLIPVATAVGIGISAYTAYTSLAGVAPVCGPLGGCAAVQNSDYSRLFGIPMGLLGLLGYAAVLVTWLAARRWSPDGGGWRWVPWLIALAGVLFSIRLTALEPFVIGHTCLWCLGSAVAMTGLLWLLSGETRGAGAPAIARRAEGEARG